MNIEIHFDFQLNRNVIDFLATHQNHPDADLDYLVHQDQNPGRACEPYVVVFAGTNDIHACALGKVQQLPIKLQFGYGILEGPSLRTLAVNRTGFVGAWRPSMCEHFIAHSLALMRTGQIDALLLHGIPLESPLHAIAESRLPFLRRDHFPIIQEYWLSTRLHSFDDFLRAHPNIRKNLGRYVNRLDRLLGGRVEIKHYHQQKDMERMLADSEEVAKKTWQRNLGAPSFCEQNQRSIYEFQFRKGWGKGYLLYLDGIPIAFKHGLLYRGVFYVGRMGYDPAYAQLRVGTYLRINVIKDLCGNSTVHTMDYNVGNSEAKRQYCDSFFLVSNIHLFGPSPRVQAFNALRLMAQGSHQLAKSLSRKAGIYQGIRKRWRQG